MSARTWALGVVALLVVVIVIAFAVPHASNATRCRPGYVNQPPYGCVIPPIFQQAPHP